MMINHFNIKLCVLIIFSLLILITFGTTAPETYNNYVICIRECNTKHIPIISPQDLEGFTFCYRQCREIHGVL